LNQIPKSKPICPHCGESTYFGHWLVPIREEKGIWICKKEIDKREKSEKIEKVNNLNFW
jgi:ribosomal protein L37AE/L43A